MCVDIKKFPTNKLSPMGYKMNDFVMSDTYHDSLGQLCN